jgi:hypothetical protein
MEEIMVFAPGDNVIAKHDPYKTIREVLSTQANLVRCEYTDPYGEVHTAEFLSKDLVFASIQNELFGFL